MMEMSNLCEKVNFQNHNPNEIWFHIIIIIING